MATNKRKAIYFPIQTAGTTTVDAYLKLQLDPDFYTDAINLKVGATDTKPADTVPVIPTNIRYAVASGLVVEKKATISIGTEPNIKTRRITVLVGRAKSLLAVALIGDNVNIGRAAVQKVWKIDAIS